MAKRVSPLPVDRITRTPEEYREFRDAQRRRLRLALQRDLQRARENREPWYEWVVSGAWRSGRPPLPSAIAGLDDDEGRWNGGY